MISERQQNIYDCWEEEDCNVVIESVAGSGKTTALFGLLERSEWRVLFLAFNKSIQLEIEEKLKNKGLKNGKALTLHSLGLSAIKTYYKPVINNNKKWEIINRFKRIHKTDLRRMSYKKQMNLIFTLMEMLDVYRIYYSNSFEILIEDMKAMGKYPEVNEELRDYWEHIKELYQEMTFKEREESVEVDFLDMIFLPVVIDDINIPVKPYYLFIDECQDLNIVQHRFINKLIGQGDIKKWVAVGDKNQSIYGFSGSYSSSFNMFLNRDNTKSFPLDVCYRCSSKVLQEANNVYDVMDFYEGNETGNVGTIQDISEIQDDSLVLCRNTAPLLKIYFELLGQERKVFIKGKDILTPTISFLKPYQKSKIQRVISETMKEIREVEDKKNDRERIRFYVLTNHLENFQILISNISLENNKVSELIYKLKQLSYQAKEPEAIELSTIHKSKGRESDVVYILEEDLIPSPFAITEDQLIQEQNLKYVARTRAKKELYYLNLK